MSAVPLHVVTGRTGEVETTIQTLDEAQREIQRLHDVIAGKDRALNAEHVRYAELKRDREKEARDHHLWPFAVDLFHYWRQISGRKGSRWNAERFWLIEPHLRPRKHETRELAALRCKVAIAGRVFDCFSKPMRNGKLKRYDDWQHVFGTTKQFDDAFERAPARIHAAYEAAVAGTTNAAPERTAPAQLPLQASEVPLPVTRQAG